MSNHEMMQDRFFKFDYFPYLKRRHYVVSLLENNGLLELYSLQHRKCIYKFIFVNCSVANQI